MSHKPTPVKSRKLIQQAADDAGGEAVLARRVLGVVSTDPGAPEQIAQGARFIRSIESGMNVVQGGAEMRLFGIKLAQHLSADFEALFGEKLTPFAASAVNVTHEKGWAACPPDLAVYVGSDPKVVTDLVGAVRQIYPQLVPDPVASASDVMAFVKGGGRVLKSGGLFNERAHVVLAATNAARARMMGSNVQPLDYGQAFPGMDFGGRGDGMRNVGKPRKDLEM